MYVKTYQPIDVFRFWRTIQGGIPVDYDFKYITVAKRGMIQFMIYIHRTKFHKIRGNKVEEFCEHFIQNKRSKFDSFFILLNSDGFIESRLHEHEGNGSVYERIECMHSAIPVERDPNRILEKIQNLKEHDEYGFWERKLKAQRLKMLFDK
ncbi:hypothetical protein [Bacillus cereus group sp. BY6-1LC]|uniref:hypothetical protein n=1 Tax=Bacillus cereus group sp. BY6-1LC TaxID=3018077 RepID=UPI0022E90033|nr:hypothetical protein [Bacillus cereus group sp. BY6-1LC]MDA1802870.1 hypothetical protein [Bacillus cereus group sp. BY6-1LC]